MKTLNREEGGKLWEAWWDEMQMEWFKVEVLQDYAAEDDSPSLRFWLAGEKQESLALLKKEGLGDWKEVLETKKHVKLVRFHIIGYPLTPYLEWEIEVYKNQNIPGGEKVFLVTKDKTEHLKLPDGDFVIFDNKRAVKNTYDKSGKCTSYDFYDESDDISYFLKLKLTLLSLGTVVK